MNKTFQWNRQKFPFSAMEAETARKFIPGAKKVAKELEDYEKNTVGVGNLLSPLLFYTKDDKSIKKEYKKIDFL